MIQLHLKFRKIAPFFVFLIKTTAPSFIIVLSCLPEIEDLIAEDTTMLVGGLIVPKGAI